jgi:hypothetical protein
MSHPASLTTNALRGLLLGGLFIALLPAGIALSQQPQPPKWSHAFDLKCRSSKDPKFDKARGFGVEVFRDENNGQGLYINEIGVLAAVPGFKDAVVPASKRRPPLWLHGLDLKIRPAGVNDFSKAKLFGLEAFRDDNNGDWLYITEVGGLAVAQGGSGYKPAADPKNPKWVHAVDLKVRAGGVKSFDKDTPAHGIEVFQDDNNGNLIYMCESGMLALVPGYKGLAPIPDKDVKEPEWMHGLDLKVRKGGQKDFDGQTKTYGLEVFLDKNTGNVIYICETGSLAVVPAKPGLSAPTKSPSEPIWTHGLDLKCRKFGKEDFTKNDAPLYGIEVFTDENVGAVIYIGETGSITAVPKP